MAETLIRVILPLPLQTTFIYQVPEGEELPRRGETVYVPLGPRRVMGVVVEVPAQRTQAESEFKVKTWLGRTEVPVVFNDELMQLTSFVADYWLCGWGEAARTALPPMVQPASPPMGFRRTREAQNFTPSERATAQQAVWERVTSTSQWTPLELIPTSSRQALKDLIAKGWIEKTDLSKVDVEREPPLTLTKAQAPILESIQRDLQSGSFGVRLIRGITGSGKTELYLQAAAQALDQGKGVLYLVPEIALTPKLIERVRRRFGNSVDWLHSARSQGERRRAWDRVERGESKFIVGTRSAIFAPIQQLGLIIVDEEHDGSYKQDESPRYHARDLAIVRAEALGVRVLLGSATPSMESYRNAVAGRYELSELLVRVFDQALPKVEFIDMREAFKEAGEVVSLSRPLVQTIQDTVAKGEQAIIFRNRRGWAPLALCTDCGERLECPQCDAALTWHQKDRKMRCHLCGFETHLPKRCPSCRQDTLDLQGVGTERLEAEISEALDPSIRVGRLDRDVARRKGAAEALLHQFSRHEIDVLVGTQMIAKGHDFPGVTLVGVLNADQALGLPDFRAGERTFQLLTQVAGRAGRGQVPGKVLVQAYDPDHPILSRAAEQDYLAFYNYEIEYRRALGYPPFKGVVLLRVSDEQEFRARQWANQLAEHYRDQTLEGLLVTGPLKPSPERIKDRYRFDILLRHASRRLLVQSVEADWPVGSGGIPRRAIRVDVDPQSFH